MIIKVFNLVIEYVSKMQFVYEEERRDLCRDLYSDAETIYRQDPILFSDATLELLKDIVPILETEEYKTKMECANLWHKNSFDIWILRIRYFLNLDPITNKKILEQKIKSAFSSNEKDFMKKHDAIIGYERLFTQVLSADDTEDHNLREDLKNLLTPDLARDIDSIIAYVSINQLFRNKKDIPSYMKTIYFTLTSFSVIEGDGLSGWIIENKIGALRTFSASLKKIGCLNASNTIRDLYDFLKDIPEAIQRDEITDNRVIEQIENAESGLLNSITVDELKVLANKYLNDNVQSNQ